MRNPNESVDESRAAVYTLRDWINDMNLSDEQAAGRACFGCATIEQPLHPLVGGLVACPTCCQRLNDALATATQRRA